MILIFVGNSCGNCIRANGTIPNPHKTTLSLFIPNKPHRLRKIFPTETSHYVVYWIGACLGSLLASVLYSIYSGNTFFGKTLPIGPIKSKPAAKRSGSVPWDEASKKKK